MKQRLSFLLKHNACLQRLYRLVMGFLFRCIGRMMKRQENWILFSSYMGTGFNDSPKAIYDAMKSQEKYQSLRCIWAFENPEQYPGLDTVRMDSFRYFIVAMKAKYWITNTNIERGLSFKQKDQLYLNTWHGVALKHIGNDCPGRKDYHFDTVNYLCVSGKYDEWVFKRAFRAREESFLRCGMPRNDALWAADEKAKAATRERLNIPKDKKVILYAPTWRDSEDGGKSYRLPLPMDFQKWKSTLGKDYLLLFRAHHLTQNLPCLPFDDFLWDVSAHADINELMIASDLLMTDYSAIAFDYAILGKPILCFAHDYEDYLAKRGTYFSIDEVYPGKMCKTEDEALERILHLDPEKEKAAVEKFRERFMEYRKNATEQCLESLFSEREGLSL